VHPFSDKDDLNLIYDTARHIWVDMQIHMVHAELQYCDNAGYGSTRWISARNSTDGAQWSDNYALRGPEAGDPPELEFYRIRPFYLGSSGRFAAHTLNYAPSPMAINRLTRYLLCIIYIRDIYIDIYIQILHANIAYILFGAGTVAGHPSRSSAWAALAQPAHLGRAQGHQRILLAPMAWRRIRCVCTARTCLRSGGCRRRVGTRWT
jgi:hypothetical protein